MSLRLGSVCTGYGGLDAGVMAVHDGAELAWTADNDPGVSAIIAHRMPDVPNLGDIRRVPWEEVPPVDVLCAGFPCQPVSGAGKQKGTADERWLWPYIADAIGKLDAPPGLLVLENVPRLLTIERGAAFAQILGSLAELGYVGCYGIYSAAEAGAPHLRKRWFLVAAADAGRPGHRAHTGTIRGHVPDIPTRTGQAKRADHRDADAVSDAQGVGRPSRQPAADRNRPGPGHHEVIPDPDSIRRVTRRARHITGSPGAAASQIRRDQAEHDGESHQRSNPAVWSSFPDSRSARLERTVAAQFWDNPQRHRQAEDSTADGSSVCCAGLDWQEYESAVRRWEMISGYPVPYPVEPGRKGNSRMTAEFPEWMMGLPPGWVTDVPGLSRSAKIRAIGNGVVPQQAAMAVADLLGRLQQAART